MAIGWCFGKGGSIPSPCMHWSMRCRKECWLPLSSPWTFGSSWPNLLLDLVKPNFINLTTHCLTYYSRKQGLNNGPILLLFYCSSIHLFKSSHLLWPMWRVWEAYVGLGHLWWSPIGYFLACPLLLGLLIGLGLKVHVGHGLGLEHDLGLDVGPSYKPCWDDITYSVSSPHLLLHEIDLTSTLCNSKYNMIYALS